MGAPPCRLASSVGEANNGYTFDCSCDTNEFSFDDIELVLTPCEKKHHNCNGARRRHGYTKTRCSATTFDKSDFGDNKMGIVVFSAGNPSRRRDSGRRRRRTGLFADMKQRKQVSEARGVGGMWGKGEYV